MKRRSWLGGRSLVVTALSRGGGLFGGGYGAVDPILSDRLRFLDRRFIQHHPEHPTTAAIRHWMTTVPVLHQS